MNCSIAGVNSLERVGWKPQVVEVEGKLVLEFMLEQREREERDSEREPAVIIIR